MQSIARILGPLCLVIGAVFLGDALATGGARLYLLLFLPVVSGTTVIFGLSVLFLVLGFLLLPFAFVQEDLTVASARFPPPSNASSAAEPVESGGLILLGPIPIFFGAWRRHPPIAYRWAIVLGAVFAVAAVLLLWGFSVL